MSDYFLDRSDYDIHRNIKDHPGMAVVIDCDGSRLFEVQKDKWTNEQIHTAIFLANEWFNIGLLRGRMEKAREIRAALEVQS